VKDSGGAGGSQRELARDGVLEINTTTGHTNVTQTAAQGTGWERHTSNLVKHNLLQDRPAPTGSFWKDVAGRARALLFNHEHFGRLPATIDTYRAQIAAAGSKGALMEYAVANPEDPLGGYVAALGRATHYVQDHLSLGHMLPGTRVFVGPIGAPLRFVIHQVFGGEVAFRDAQIRATRGLLSQAGPIS